MNDALLIWGTALWIAAIVLLFFARAEALVWTFSINLALIHLVVGAIYLLHGPVLPPAGPVIEGYQFSAYGIMAFAVPTWSFRNPAFLLLGPSGGLRSSAARLPAIIAYSLVSYLLFVAINFGSLGVVTGFRSRPACGVVGTTGIARSPWAIIGSALHFRLPWDSAFCKSVDYLPKWSEPPAPTSSFFVCSINGSRLA